MSKKSKRSVEDAIGVANMDELQEALSMIREDEMLDTDTGEILPMHADPEDEEISQEEIKAALAEAKELKAQMRQIPDILEKESEIDDIANDAAKYFEDIMDKAFNTEDRFASELFNAGNSLLKTALDGKTAIVNAKLKLLDLELKKRKMEQDFQKAGGPQEKTVNGQNVVVTDRNALLRKHNK